MSNHENEKIIEHAYEHACEKGYGPYIDDGLVLFDLEGACHYLGTGEFIDATIINKRSL